MGILIPLVFSYLFVFQMTLLNDRDLYAFNGKAKATKFQIYAFKFAFGNFAGNITKLIPFGYLFDAPLCPFPFQANTFHFMAFVSSRNSGEKKTAPTS